MGDSDEDLPEMPTGPRVKRFRFRTFAQRVADVEIDVYRRLHPVRAEPWQGATSFFQEHLLKWRELNSTEHFLKVEFAVRPLTETLPMLLHHKETILTHLLSAMHMRAHLSLPAILHLTSVLARDLQHEYLPFFPRVMEAISNLIENGGSQDADVLESIFTAVSFIFKYLTKQLSADLPGVLRQTAAFRYSRAHHVRVFAAQAVGYLLRSCPQSVLRGAVRAVLFEQAVRPNAERTDGAGLLLAESVLGVSHGLHSRTQAVLGLMLQQDLLLPEDFKRTTDSLAAVHAVQEADAPTSQRRMSKRTRLTKEPADAAADVVEPMERADGGSGMTREGLRARAAAVAAVAVDRILNHLRRGKGRELWDILVSEVDRRTSDAESAAASLASTSAKADASLAEAASDASASLARAVALVTRAVCYYRGSRVESYLPITDLLSCLLRPSMWASSTLACAEPSQLATATNSLAFEYYLNISLSGETLGLALALVYGHGKAAGASEGLGALLSLAPSWSPCFSRPPPRQLLSFCSALLAMPGYGVAKEVAEMFGRQMLGATGKVVLLSSTEGTISSTISTQLSQSALAVLLDICTLGAPSASSQIFSGPTSSLPFLLTAQPGGVKLAAYVRQLALSATASATESATQASKGTALYLNHPPHLRMVWAATQMLRHACENLDQAVTACEHVRTQAAAAGAAAYAAAAATATASAAADDSTPVNTPSEDATLQAFMLLHGTTTELLSDLLQLQCSGAHKASHGPAAVAAHKRLVTAAEASLTWLRAHLTDLWAAQGAGTMLTVLRQQCAKVPAAMKLLSAASLQALLPGLVNDLASPSQAHRAAVLRVMCAFDVPMLIPASNDKSGVLIKCEVFDTLMAINTQSCTLEAGRRWAVALIRQGSHAEFGRLPKWVVPALVMGLLGILHVRFSPLWPAACTALAACVQHHAQVAWPLVLQALKQTQAEFLAGGSNSHQTLSQSKSGGAAKYGKKRAREPTKRQPATAVHEGGSDPNAAEDGQEDGEGAVDAGDVDMEVGGASDGEEEDASHAEVEENSSNNFGMLCKVETLQERFSLALQAGSATALGVGTGSTDAANRLGHLLKALSKVPSEVLEKVSKEWTPLLLEFAASKTGAEADAEAGIDTGTAEATPGAMSRVGARAWRQALQEWMTLLSGLRGARGLYKAADLQRCIALHLADSEGPLQSALLRCLRVFKIKYVGPYIEHMLQLADDKQLRLQLVRFPMARGADGGVSEEHRPGFIPLLARILYPKLRKRGGRLGGKGAPGSARAAILNFFAGADAMELQPLIELFLAPIDGVFSAALLSQAPLDASGAAAAKEQESLGSSRLLPAPWWGAHLGTRTLGWWLVAADAALVEALPARRKVSFLNTFEDLLLHLGHNLLPFLPPLVAIALHMLQSATSCLVPTAGGLSTSAEDRDREVRVAALKLLAQVFERFPEGCQTYEDAWGPFMTAIQPLVPRLSVEAAADKPPALLQCISSLSASPNLACVLGNMTARDMASIQPEGLPLMGKPRSGSGSGSSAPWAQQHMGGGLMRACIGMLAAHRCSDGCRSAVLDIIDNLLAVSGADPVSVGGGAFSLAEAKAAKRKQMEDRADRKAAGDDSESDDDAMQGAEGAAKGVDVSDSDGGVIPPLLALVLVPWIEELLVALRVVVCAAWECKSGSVERGKRRPTAFRELAILERLGVYVQSAEAALQLGDALAALIGNRSASAGGSSGGARKAGSAKARLDERGLSRALGALAVLWGRCGAVAWEGALPEGCMSSERMWGYCETMSGLAVRLSSREGRLGLAAAFSAASKLLPDLVVSSDLLSDLMAWSTNRLDEPDYDRRLGAYIKLVPEFWAGLSRRQALPLLMACLYDLRNGQDLALRQSAMQALSRLLDGCKIVEEQSALSSTDSSDPPDSPLRLLSRVLYPQIKSQLSANSLSVRQEHLSLLRVLAIGFPHRFPDLTMLISATDPEVDFLLNIAHLQLHRRARALLKLATMAEAGSTAGAAAAAAADASASVVDYGATAAGFDAAASVSGSLVRCLQDVCLPLVQGFLLEGGGAGANDVTGERGGHGRKANEEGKEANVSYAAVAALGAAAGVLPWPQYEQLLNQYLKLMKAKPTKAMVRAVCAILDAFHFPLPRDHCGAAAVAEAAEVASKAAALAAAKVAIANAETATAGTAAVPVEAVAALEEDGADDDIAVAAEAIAEAEAIVEADVDTVEFCNSMLRSLQLRVLPALHDFLLENQEVVRAPVAIALVKLLRVLPKECERVELPRTLHGICNLLRNRLQRVRDDARVVLVQVAKELGPTYMPYICSVLRSACPDKGFTAHVVGYTMHAVLDTLVKADAKAYADDAKAHAGDADAQMTDADDDDGAVGALDDSVELILPMIEGELFGEIAEAKEVAQFACNYKEAKKVRAYESFQLLASSVTFQTQAEPLLSLIRSKLHLASAPSVRNKLSQLLQYGARGFHSNRTATSEQLMLWVHSAMKEGLAREEASRQQLKADVGTADGATMKKVHAPVGNKRAFGILAPLPPAMTDEARAALHEYMLVEFALHLMYSSVRKGPLTSSSPQTLALLDPLLPLLVRALRCRHSGSVSLALRTMSVLVHLPLPSLGAGHKVAANAGKAVTDLLKRVPNAAHPIALECFKLLGAMLRDCAGYQPSTTQIRFLLSWLFADRHADDSADRQNSFALLRSILGRKLVVPEIYDVMNWVQGLMVKSQSAPVRQMCASTFLQFLLDYPLGPKRLRKHLTFLITNASYEYESGRLQVLEMLMQVACKFPPEVVREYSELLLLPLVTRMVNDQSPKCRTLVASLITTLLCNMEASKVDQMMGFAVSWMGQQDKPQMRRAAAQLLGCMVEAEGVSRFGRRLPQILPSLLEILEQQAIAGSALDGGASLDADEASQAPGWQEAYFALLVLEKAAGPDKDAPTSSTPASSALAWPKSEQAGADVGSSTSSVPAVWEAVMGLLLHRHLWVRKAAARLLGVGLASPSISCGLWAKPSRAGELAFSLFLQLENEAADESTCRQGIKCLISVASRLHDADVASGWVGSTNASTSSGTTSSSQAGAKPSTSKQAFKGGESDEEEGEDDEVEEEEVEEAGTAGRDRTGDADGDDEDEDGKDVVPMGEQVNARAFTLRGLFRRMSRMADDSRYNFQEQRCAALRWIAAAASKLGAAAMAPFLDLILLPLYRLSEPPSAGVTVLEEVKALGDEVMAHLRELLGSDVHLQAYTAARDQIRNNREERKKKAAMKVMLDPEAAARARVKRGAKKAVGRKRKMEQDKRTRTMRTKGGRGSRDRGE